MRPEALSKRMVISGPRSDSVCQASQAPISALTIGMAQISDSRRRRSSCERTTALGCRGGMG